MLFKSYLVEPILNGKKTETRRPWTRCLVKVGGVYKAKVGYGRNSVFGNIKITYVRRERLGNIDPGGVRREGCTSLDEFKQIWIDAYGSWEPGAEVYVIGFQLV